MYNPYFSQYPHYPQYQVNNNLSMPSQIIGKIVDNPSDIGVNDVPMDGNVAVFPNRNLKEIYIKQWNSNGTISTNVYRLIEAPIITETTNTSSETKEGLNEAILKKLENIEKLLTTKSGKEIKEAKHE